MKGARKWLQNYRRMLTREWTIALKDCQKAETAHANRMPDDVVASHDRVLQTQTNLMTHENKMSHLDSRGIVLFSDGSLHLLSAVEIAWNSDIVDKERNAGQLWSSASFGAAVATVAAATASVSYSCRRLPAASAEGPE